LKVRSKSDRKKLKKITYGYNKISEEKRFLVEKNLKNIDRMK